MTALYDASFNSIEAALAYGKTLVDADFSVNAIVFVMTDGMDNKSTYGRNKVKEALQRAVKGEMIESMVSVLIGVNVTEPEVDHYLTMFKNDSGFTQYVKVDDATPQRLAKLAEFVSKSISSQSQAINSGAPSQPLNLTI